MDKNYLEILTHGKCFEFLSQALVQNDKNYSIQPIKNIDITDDCVKAAFRIWNHQIGHVSYGEAEFYPFACVVNYIHMSKRYQKEFAKYIYDTIQNDPSLDQKYSAQQYREDYNNYCLTIKKLKENQAQKDYESEILDDKEISLEQ